MGDVIPVPAAEGRPSGVEDTGQTSSCPLTLSSGCQDKTLPLRSPEGQTGSSIHLTNRYSKNKLLIKVNMQTSFVKYDSYGFSSNSGEGVGEVILFQHPTIHF